MKNESHYELTGGASSSTKPTINTYLIKVLVWWPCHGKSSQLHTRECTPPFCLVMCVFVTHVIIMRFQRPCEAR